MSDERIERNDERVEDLEVRGDEAREIAGGKKGQKKGSLGRRKARAAGMADKKSGLSREA